MSASDLSLSHPASSRSFFCESDTQPPQKRCRVDRHIDQGYSVHRRLFSLPSHSPSKTVSLSPERRITSPSSPEKTPVLSHKKVGEMISKASVLSPSPSKQWQTPPPSTPVKRTQQVAKKTPDFYAKIPFHQGEGWLQKSPFQFYRNGDHYVVFEDGPRVRKTPRKYTPKGKELTKSQIESMMAHSLAQYRRLKAANLPVAKVLNYDSQSPSKVKQEGYLEMERYSRTLQAKDLSNPKIFAQVKQLVEYPYLHDKNEYIDLKPDNIAVKGDNVFLIDFLEVPPQTKDDQEAVLGQFISLLLDQGLPRGQLEILIENLPKKIQENFAKNPVENFDEDAFIPDWLKGAVL